jgi:hypothetical protein
MSPNRIRQRIHCSHGFRCALVRVNADLAEIMAEARFHKGAYRGIERLTGRVQHFVDNWGNS